MGIRDRDYMKDWRPPEDWEPESESRKAPRKPWTLGRILAWASIVLLILALVLVAALPRG